ncbi:hypothetical protein COF36_23080, partial [Bacillus pseudomycoides]|uniref:hypothetical protein n=1 Tax=Bacillus pseudomycoides TaxID=64104 RepID=UPI000C030617
VAAVTPVPLSWPIAPADREKFESMLVAPQGRFTVSNTYTTNQYAEIGLASGENPLITPADVARVGTQEYTDAVADNAARGVVLDDGASIN